LKKITEMETTALEIKKVPRIVIKIVQWDPLVTILILEVVHCKINFLITLE